MMESPLRGALNVLSVFDLQFSGRSGDHMGWQPPQMVLRSEL